ncbi:MULTISPECIES: phage tail domain-containing protein [Lactiplantibacillus]|uniref:Phage tail family protein n=3 Tax=Lactiplantibacillus pentosus TaxID=1589 RepID=A0AAW8WDJ7_LACPE|nr:phage tail domain-containing protein [Lactiplantibacillus pentosus]MBU7484657.1 phage tail family protein [Lactiplantibacillus sp. 30.2.29]MBU7461474.1 phage tail family protein [Lactiplantibacillus pentosus]MBU7478102.1 phage tail family protein [Lactiplantibacillus pentosus]MBU7488020.1 phage tail family protein [Lactiplantibacillus pentosus]MBU7501122.1 phage tail family protein [Lactiplantibacillus pentosus]
MTLQRDDFEYAGLNSRDDLQVEMGNVVLPSAPAMAEQVTDIPAMYGNQFNGTDFTSRTISIPVSIYCADNQDRFNQIMHNLSGLLLSDDPSDNGKEYPLVFGFEPKVTYWGHITAISDPAPINPGMYDMSLTITFVQSDPRATLPQVEKPLNNGLNTITVEGTARTAPVIQVVPKRDLKHIGFTLNGGEYGLGPDSDEDQAVAVQPYTQVVNSDVLNTMAEWTNDANAIAQMKTAGDYIYQGEADSNRDTQVLMVKLANGVKQYGSHQPGWYGPGVRFTGMTNSLTNYRVKTRIHHIKHSGTHNGRAMGRVEVLLLDPNGATIGRFGLADSAGGGTPTCYLQITKPGGAFAGGDGKHKTLFMGKGPSGSSRNGRDQKIKIKTGTTTKTVVKRSRNRHGKVTTRTIKRKVNKYTTVVNKEEKSALSTSWLELDLIKNGKVFSWSITQYYTSGRHNGQPCKDPKRFLIVHGTFVDRDSKYQSDLGGIGGVFFKHSITEDDQKVGYENPYLSITHLDIYRVNDVAQDAPKYIANAGQEIVLNCETDSTTVGGKLASPIWSTDYPKLSPGVNNLTMIGDLDDAQITLKYLPRLL